MSSSESSPVSDALQEFIHQLSSFFMTVFHRFTKNFRASFTEVSWNRWTKVILSVIGYILIRPYIEKFFKVMHERERAKRKEKEKEQKEKDGVKGKKAKVSANALRNQGSGKVLGEVQESDDEIESGDSDEEEEVEENVNENDIPDEEDEGKASGVPEWGRHARKRQKKYLKGLEKNRIAEPVSLSDEQMLEMLDWSESEEEKAGNDATAAA